MAHKQRTGVVVSDKMNKTVVVRIERTVTHPLYHKVLRRRKQYQAHDETNLAKLGDRVLIEECRPISRNKKWRVLEVLERHEVADLQPQEIAAPAITPEPSAAPAQAPAETSAAPEASTSEASTPDASAPEPSTPEPSTPDLSTEEAE
jgi:small subunit ribosomal protein S17